MALGKAFKILCVQDATFMNCIVCSDPCIKKGIKNNIQTYYCSGCCRYQRLSSIKMINKKILMQDVIRFHNEGVSIRGMARLLGVSAGTVINYLKQIYSRIDKPVIKEHGQEYEIDELQTYTGKNTPSNYIWIAYAINRKTRQVIDFVVGKRTKENIKMLTDKISGLQPKCIYTDGLNIYRSLIDKSIHKVQAFKINYIERKNLTLRTHLKRLNRKTICFSRSIAMLQACLMIYFFG